MELTSYFKKSINLFFLKEKSYEEIDEYNVGTSILLYMIITFLGPLIYHIIDCYNTDSMKSKTFLIFTNTFGFVLFSFISIFISYGLFHLVFKLLKGKGSFEDTLKFGVTIGIFPLFIFQILNIIYGFIYRETLELSFNTFDIIAVSIYGILVLILLIWSLVVTIKTYSKVHDMSYKRVIASILIVTFVGIVLLSLVILILYLLIYTHGQI
jgi:hypothetical protein